MKPRQREGSRDPGEKPKQPEGEVCGGGAGVKLQGGPGSVARPKALGE